MNRNFAVMRCSDLRVISHNHEEKCSAHEFIKEMLERYPTERYTIVQFLGTYALKQEITILEIA